MQHDLINHTIDQHARQRPQQVALRGAASSLTYNELQTAIQKMVQLWGALCAKLPPTIALAVENHPAWVVLDMAALHCKTPLIPLPFFFSPAQWLHAMQDAGAQVLVTDQPQRFEPLFTGKIAKKSQFVVAEKTLTQFEFHTSHHVALPLGTAKITYTSGTTGNPKGVCLSVNNMLNVAGAIAKAAQLSTSDIHLCVLPLATLLENIAGVYASLLAGATCVLLPSNATGLNGAAGLDIKQLLATLKQHQASTAIFTPELLQALVSYVESGATLSNDLRFLAVGGASVSPTLLKHAEQLSIPVYEGYGLSECASVVALNVPACNKIGSVGKVLPHVKIDFTGDHEIIVTGNAYLGYVGQKYAQLNSIATGDIGHLDADGYLFISGRKKNIFITSFGRNVSPEWVERELKISPHIAQAALFGEARPWNIAVITPKPRATPAQIENAIQAVNEQLPDYARITRWIIADEPFSVKNSQLTSNGRNRRDMIWQHYQTKINALYEGNIT